MSSLHVHNYVSTQQIVLVKKTQEKQVDTKDFQKQFIRLIRLLASLESILVKNESNTMQNKAKIGEVGAKVSDAVFKAEVKKLKEQLAKIEAMKHAGFWHKVFGIALSVVMCVGALVTAGIGTAAVVTALTVLQETGMIDKMAKKISPDSSIGKAFVKFAIIAAFMVAGSMTAKGVDTALESLGKNSSKRFAKALSQTEGKGLFVQDSYKFAAVSTFSQMLVVLNPVQDMIEGISGKKDTLAASIISMLINMIAVLGSGYMMRNSFAMSKLVEDPKILSRITTCEMVLGGGAAIGEGSTGIFEGVMQLQISEITKKMATYSAILTLITTGQRISSDQKDELQHLMQSFAEIEKSYKLLSIPGEAEAQELMN